MDCRAFSRLRTRRRVQSSLVPTETRREKRPEPDKRWESYLQADRPEPDKRWESYLQADTAKHSNYQLETET
jgi:hypothetical protein